MGTIEIVRGLDLQSEIAVGAPPDHARFEGHSVSQANKIDVGGNCNAGHDANARASLRDVPDDALNRERTVPE
jgi:hypothetical protein